MPSPYGTAPECASIGFQDGKAVGSASPLTWSAAQFTRLAHDLSAGAVTERPTDTVARYLDRHQGEIPLTLTAPENNSTVGSTVTVTGSTTAGATVDVDAVNIDIDGNARTASTVAGQDGSFSVDVPVPPGTAVLTAVATAPDGSTGFAQRTVVFDTVPGNLIYTTDDPDGDDNGPGTYAYPLSDNFHAGAYDLEQFQVYDSGTDAVTFRVRTKDLTPTFGPANGAQMVDVYVDNPAGGATTTKASFPQRNYTMAANSAWNRLIEVQGFGQRFIDAGGVTVGSVNIRANPITRYITFTVSKNALGGTPGAGWGFTVVLTGQDGFSPDQARGFQAIPADFQFGVCTKALHDAGTNPICAVDPNTVPKAMDVFTPPGVSQATGLDPTPAGQPVTLEAIRIN
jgi:hypothetical protein